MAVKLKTPLRYPGGKAKLKRYTTELIQLNNLQNCTYVEAFAGGSGLAMELLFSNVVDRVILNDLDKSIYALWHCILTDSTKLIDMINSIDITIDEWNIQKNIQNNKENVDLLSLAYSTLFLNRTNRSGILKAGPIGGKNQDGNYLLDCRFKKNDIIERITNIALLADRIEFYNMDALDFIDYLNNNAPENTFIFFDPPYFDKGPELYINHYIGNDHRNLSEKIFELNFPWIITYDNIDYIKDLYNEHSQTVYYLNYSAQKSHKGKEVMIYSDNMIPLKLEKAY